MKKIIGLMIVLVIFLGTMSACSVYQSKSSDELFELSPADGLDSVEIVDCNHWYTDIMQFDGVLYDVTENAGYVGLWLNYTKGEAPNGEPSFEGSSVLSKQYIGDCDAGYFKDRVYYAIQEKYGMTLIDKTVATNIVDPHSWDGSVATLHFWKFPESMIIAENVKTGELALFANAGAIDKDGFKFDIKPGDNALWGTVEIQDNFKGLPTLVIRQ